VAVYNDPDDYRTPLFQERQREIAAKVARVNEALEALREALS
jgi:hypothetical protein